MKKRSIVLLGLLALLLNSCVYSLFPIYTEDTLVFKEELLGKWDFGDNSFMIFERGSEKERTENSDKKKEEKVAKKLLDKSLSKTEDKVIDYKVSVSVFEEKSYRLRVVDQEKNTEKTYTAHLVDLGGDLFLDLYPTTHYDSKDFYFSDNDNYFPVHTFYKVKVTKNKFTMINFDLGKLTDLFESNLIRLRHENVDGTILITAQPKELQKFFDKYADDESVFDSEETYARVSL